MTKVFINGEFLNQEDAKVSYEDRVMYLEMVYMNIFVHTTVNYLQ